MFFSVVQFRFFIWHVYFALGRTMQFPSTAVHVFLNFPREFKIEYSL